MLADLIGHPSCLTQGSVPELLLRLIVRDHIACQRPSRPTKAMLHMRRAAMQTRSLAGQLTAETLLIIGDPTTHSHSSAAANSNLDDCALSSSSSSPSSSSCTSPFTLSALPAPTDRFSASDVCCIAASRSFSPSTSCTISQGVAGFDLPKPLHLCARARRSDIPVKHSRATSRMLQSAQLLFRISKIRHARRTLIP